MRLTPASPSPIDIVLDLSRLMSRVLHPTPTGVDRVEMAYARGLLAAVGDRLAFAAVHPLGMYGRLDTSAVLAFLDRTERQWERGELSSQAELRVAARRTLLALRPRRTPPPGARQRVYVLASPHNLTKPRLVEAVLRRERARFACLVHDMIPLEYPEYARPEGAAEQRTRVATIVDHADAILANTAATLASLHRWIERSGRSPACAVAHLGADPRFGTAPCRATLGGRPTFVMLGTIEPRKNHLLLLHIWRRLSEQRGAAAVPRLVLVGRRGWENEQIIDLLERCPALQGCVEEHACLPDAELRALLAGARAMLLPSFAEGFGLPVIEALTAGVPVICSDLPALREAGSDVPDFLDPLDAPAWIRLIDSYSGGQSPEREAQLLRLSRWQAPTWQEHIAILLALLHRVAT